MKYAQKQLALIMLHVSNITHVVMYVCFHGIYVIILMYDA